MKPHEQRDLSNLVHERTLALITRSADVFAPSPQALSTCGAAAMRAGFIALFCGAKMEGKPFTAEELLFGWAKLALKDLPELEQSFLKAKEQK